MGNQSLIRESERRQATVMFADISGFTSMSEQLDPEEITFIMNDCFELMGHIVEEYGGTIDKFIGDCIMALFGAPKALEDAPVRALNAAIEIRNKLQELNRIRNLSTPLGVHIGINTGMVVAGVIGAAGKKE